MRRLFRKSIFKADPNVKMQGINFYSIRLQVVSRLFYTGSSLRDIMTHMNWRSSSVLGNYYSLLGLQGDIDAIGASQHHI